MTSNNLTEPLKEGQAVKVLNSSYAKAIIAEYRGPLGPKGARIYRIMVGRRPPQYMEVREDQLEVIETRDVQSRP